MPSRTVAKETTQIFSFNSQTQAIAAALNAYGRGSFTWIQDLCTRAPDNRITVSKRTLDKGGGFVLLRTKLVRKLKLFCKLVCVQQTADRANLMAETPDISCPDQRSRYQLLESNSSIPLFRCVNDVNNLRDVTCRFGGRWHCGRHQAKNHRAQWRRAFVADPRQASAEQAVQLP